MDEKKTSVELEMTEETNGGALDPEQIKRVSVRIGGREIPLLYSTRAQIAIDDALEMDFDSLRQELNQRRKPNMKVVAVALRIMGNEGLRRAGETPDLTDDWVIDHIIPKDAFAYRVAELTALMKGWYMESDNSDEEDVDVTLIEIRKKKENTD